MQTSYTTNKVRSKGGGKQSITLENIAPLNLIHIYNFTQPYGAGTALIFNQ